MANATPTKTSPATAPTSKDPVAEALAKIPPKPTPEELTQLIEESRGRLEGVQITVETDSNPAVAPAASAQEGTTLGFFNEDMPALPEGKYGFRPLSKKEMDELAAHEETLRVGLPQFLTVAQALLDIQKKKLWRLYARSFADYCDRRVGISRVWAHMQASAAEAMQNLLTSGEQMDLPTTERQLRPLAGLDAKVQVAAWKLALQKALGKKATGKQVEDAVKEVSGDVVSQSEWLAKIRQRLVSAGYETDFVQPVDVGEKEWIDFWHEPSNVFVKLVDEPSLSSMGICLAMREQNLKCQVILNGASLGKKKLTAHHDGTLDRLLDPVLSVFMHTLGAFLERDETLYEAGALGKDSTLELKPSNSPEANDLRSALEPQMVAAPAEAEVEAQ